MSGLPPPAVSVALAPPPTRSARAIVQPRSQSAVSLEGDCHPSPAMLPCFLLLVQRAQAQSPPVLPQPDSPILPPILPPPPMAPSPPSPPPGLCTNTCNTDGGGAPGRCDDGGPVPGAPNAARWPLCLLGTDCDDCGVRVYCTECSDECKAQNLLDPASACLESDYANDVCDTNCNTLACEYDGGKCSINQITTKCLDDVPRLGIDYATMPTSGGLVRFERVAPPSEGGDVLPESRIIKRPPFSGSIEHEELWLVPVAVHLNLITLRLIIDNEFEELLYFQELFYTLQWSDERLARSPCAGALTRILSLTVEQGLSDPGRERQRDRRELFWVPPLTTGQSEKPGYRALDEVSQFEYADGPLEGYPSSYFAGKEGNASTTCPGCVRVTNEIELISQQPHLNFFYFPFDHQTIELIVQVEGSYLYGCNGTGATSPVLAGMGLTEENKNELLLPPTGEWYMDKPLAEAISVYHPRDAQNYIVPYQCAVSIRVKRNPQVFIFRSLITTIVVVLGSLVTALFMHPAIYVGDRAAVLFIAFLITLTNIATTDLRLGRISYLLWLDVFNFIQLLLTILCVLETMIVHYLYSKNNERLGSHIDHVSRVTLPFLYVFVTAGAFLIGVSNGRGEYTRLFDGGVALSVVSIVILVPTNICLTVLRATAQRRRQAKAVTFINQAIELQDEKKLDDAVKRAFDAFDTDASGELDLDEMRNLFFVLHPDADREVRRKCVAKMREHIDIATGTVTLPSFLDALLEAEAVLEAEVEADPDMLKTKQKSRGMMTRRGTTNGNVLDNAFAAVSNVVSQVTDAAVALTGADEISEISVHGIRQLTKRVNELGERIGDEAQAAVNTVTSLGDMLGDEAAATFLGDTSGDEAQVAMESLPKRNLHARTAADPTPGDAEGRGCVSPKASQASWLLAAEAKAIGEHAGSTLEKVPEGTVEHYLLGHTINDEPWPVNAQQPAAEGGTLSSATSSTSKNGIESQFTVARPVDLESQ